jgi:hypothetical protein
MIIHDYKKGDCGETMGERREKRGCWKENVLKWHNEI